MITLKAEEILWVRTIPNPDPDQRQWPLMSIKFKDGTVSNIRKPYLFQIK